MPSPPTPLPKRERGEIALTPNRGRDGKKAIANRGMMTHKKLC